MSSTSPSYQDKSVLKRLYLDEGLNHGEIADELGCCRDTISRWVRKHGISKGTECPECGIKYEYLGSHWDSGSCSHPPLDPYEDVITGLLMGDGSINRMDGKNPSLHVVTVEKDFADHLTDLFGPLASSVGEVDASQVENKFGSQVQYEFRTRRHPGLEPWAEWYSSGKKRFPDKVSISLETLNYWYSGDGNYYNRDGRLPEMHIASLNEIDRIEWLRDRVEYEIGLSPSTEDKGIALYSTEALQFFEQVDPLPGYEYKHPDDDTLEQIREDAGFTDT